MAPVRPERATVSVDEAPALPTGQSPGPVSSPGGEGPVRLYHGSLYQNPDGSLVLAFQAEGSDETHRRHIPAALAQLMAGGGSPVQVARAMMKGARNGVD